MAFSVPGVYDAGDMYRSHSSSGQIHDNLLCSTEPSKYLISCSITKGPLHCSLPLNPIALVSCSSGISFLKVNINYLFVEHLSHDATIPPSTTTSNLAPQHFGEHCLTLQRKSCVS